jgi:flagellar hook-basal body complex protein FliE
MKRALLSLSFLLCMPCLAMAQDAAAGNTAVPGPLDWALQAGAPGVLAVVLWKLWGHYQEKEKSGELKGKEHEDEKAEMRKIYTQEINKLQEQVRRSQEERHKEQNELLREVLTTAQTMSQSLDANTRVVEQLTQHMED